MMDEKKGLIELGWFGEMPPRQEGMTEQDIDRLEIVYKPYYGESSAANAVMQLIATYRSQRETITRLEGMLEEAVGKLTLLTDGEVTVADLRESIDARGQLAQLQARLTASEAANLEATRLLNALKCSDDIYDPKERDIWEQVDKFLAGHPVKSAHKWTRERPTAAGWYWYRVPNAPPCVVQVGTDGLGICVWWSLQWQPVETWNGEWQGPITPGEE